MFKLANKPPHGPEDLTFSESGQALLVDARQCGSGKFSSEQERIENARDTISILGSAACVELADILEGVAEPGTNEFNDYGRRVIEEAAPILGPDKLAFIEGLNIASFSYLPQPEEEKVAA